MKRTRGNSGHTVIELIIVLGGACTLLFAIMCLIGVPRANCWYAEDGMKQKLFRDKAITSVQHIERNIFNPTVIDAAMQSGKIIQICLDTNIFFDYEFTPCE